MQFCKLQDGYSMVRNLHGINISIEDYYHHAMRNAMRITEAAGCADQAFNMQLDMFSELHWWKNGRPYYNVWPAITESLLNFDVSKVPFNSFLSAPDPYICVQFQEGGFNGVMCIVVSVIPCGKVSPLHHIIVCTEQRTEYVRTQLGREYKSATQICAVSKDDEFRSLQEMVLAEESMKLTETQNICLSVLLMERDSDLFEPDILRKDTAKYQNASEEDRKRIAERAFKRRNQRGYHVGRQVETIPHYRRPHPALYWTGNGRRTAKVVFRSGCVVKRNKMTEAPTGRLGTYGESDHDND